MSNLPADWPRSFQSQKRKRRESQTQTGYQRQPKSCDSPASASQNSSNAKDRDRHMTTDHPRPGVESGSISLQQNPSESRINIYELSFILHPSHEVPILGKSQSLGRTKDNEPQLLLYFTNMVAISLFHQPSFANKLEAITSKPQISALLAAMIGYAARFYSTEPGSVSHDKFQRVQTTMKCPPPHHFLHLAGKLVDESLAECGDEPPPICVLQALIITTHCQLTRGVYGKAWRALGMCLRLAYELNLHLIDARRGRRNSEMEPLEWRGDEEKRRAWWAIWEMDTYASTIRRTPRAWSWTHMDIFLPVDDADWFSDRPCPSAILERDPTKRWKALQTTRNHSPKAWYLVISSLTKDAQMISDPRGDTSQQIPGSTNLESSGRGRSPGEEARQHLEMLANAVQCFVLALPQHLRYRNQHLSFNPHVPSQPGLFQLHCGIYNIFIMTQMARLMIHRCDLFRQPVYAARSDSINRGAAPSSSSSTPADLENPSMRQYFEASDNILAIVSHSDEDHVKHINPFLLSTIWLACAVQLVRMYVSSSRLSPGLIKSRFDLLYLTYKRCVSFWDAKTALQEKLESLEVQLESRCGTSRGERQTSCEGPKGSSTEGHMPCSSGIPDKSTSEEQVTAIPSRTAGNFDENPTTDPFVAGLRKINPNTGKSPAERHHWRSAGGQYQLLSGRTPSSVEWGCNRTTESANAMAVPVNLGRPIGTIISEPSRQPPQESLVCTMDQGFRLPPSPTASHHTLEDTTEINQSVPGFMQMPSASVMDLATMVPSHTEGVHVQDAQGNALEWWHLDLPSDVKHLLSEMSTY
ncbi:hypothetical protein MHUMG1_07662 [Metarhizium humberi]|uniref:Xylanolytic transcriptional activator regulatory domain-containing protein n=1 Tax=Metarhizium humberi TaxID=2596975 RepID=A0A9P8S5I3_9HYPO|nr:hypothetical protein MHUMG1_07662 [Metarhizium humberi]